MVSFIGLQGQLLFRGQAIFFEFVYLVSKHNIRLICGVNTVGFEGNQELSTVFQVHMRVFRNDTGLIRLSNISENNIDHPDNESIIQRLSSIMDDWDNIGSLLGHIDQISTHSM